MPWNKKMISMLIDLQVDFGNMLVWIFVLAHTTKLGSSQWKYEYLIKQLIYI